MSGMTDYLVPRLTVRWSTTVAVASGVTVAGLLFAMLSRPTFGLYVVDGISLVAALAAAGMATFVVVTPRDVPVQPLLRSPAIVLALVAFAAALLTLPFDIMNIADDGLRGLGNGLARSAALRSGDYQAVVTRAAGLILVVTGFRANGRGARATLFFGALLVTGSYALMGHVRTHSPEAAVIAAVIAHVTAAATWFGGLIGLGWSLRRAGDDIVTCGRLLTAFARAMTGVLALLLAAGVGLAILYLPTQGALVHTAYGQVLLIKLATLGGVLVLSTANHLRFVSAASLGNKQALGVLRANIAAEQIGLVAILAVTEVLMRQNPGS